MLKDLINLMWYLCVFFVGFIINNEEAKAYVTQTYRSIDVDIGRASIQNGVKSTFVYKKIPEVKKQIETEGVMYYGGQLGPIIVHGQRIVSQNQETIETAESFEEVEPLECPIAYIEVAPLNTHIPETIVLNT